MEEVKKYSKHKFVFLIIIFVLSIFFSGFFSAENVYASELYPEVPYSDGRHWAVLKRKSDEQLFLLATFPGEEIVVIDDVNSDYYMQFKPLMDYGWTARTINQYALSPDGLTWSEEGTTYNSESVNDYIILDANKDIKFVYSDTVFFSALTPPKVPVTQEGMNQALAQVLSLLPVMMILMVGLVGLRKALRILSEVLRRA